MNENLHGIWGDAPAVPEGEFNILTLRFDLQSEQWNACFDETDTGYRIGVGSTIREAIADAVVQIKEIIAARANRVPV